MKRIVTSGLLAATIMLAACHRDVRALECYDIFHVESDNFFNMECKVALSEMHALYETDKGQKEFRGKQYEVLRERCRIQITGLLAVTAAVLLVMWILYKRKNTRYLHIVRQYQAAIQREKTLAEGYRISEKDGMTGGGSGNTAHRRSATVQVVCCSPG